MKYTRFLSVQSVLLVLAAAFAGLMLGSQEVQGATWKGLEPLVSKRADVERVLGPPTADRLAKDGTLQFAAPEGAVTVFFVTPKFIAARKLPPRVEGTVLLILVQHKSSTVTPGSMRLPANQDFERQVSGPKEIYSNPKDGIYHTFLESRLDTTRYSYSAERFTKLQDELKTPSPS
jgi:hypothetical protein